MNQFIEGLGEEWIQDVFYLNLHLLHFIRLINHNIFQEYDNAAESLVSSLFVNSLEDEDYDVGECH